MRRLSTILTMSLKCLGVVMAIACVPPAMAYEPKPYWVPPMTNDEIRSVMIEESNERHKPCACPYNPDALGGQCGTESLYYRPGGYRIWCYMKDISPQEVAFYRLRVGT